MEYLETGKIVNVHGLKGDVKVLPWADLPEVLLEFDEFFIDGVSYTVENARIQKESVLVKFKGVDTVEAAEKLRNKVIYINKEELELDEGVYFIEDLIGLSVYDADSGELYGKITDVLQNGAHDVYEITSDGPESRKLYAPAIAECEIAVSLPEKKMIIRPIKGLFDI